MWGSLAAPPPSLAALAAAARTSPLRTQATVWAPWKPAVPHPPGLGGGADWSLGWAMVKDWFMDGGETVEFFLVHEKVKLLNDGHTGFLMVGHMVNHGS